MEQEYLFEGKQNRKQVERYAQKECRVDCEIEELEGSDCWVARFSIRGNGEKEASVLSALHQDIDGQYKPIVLHNGAAEYFTGELYPYFSTYERRLRKFLYLKSALCTDEEVGQQVKDLEEKDLSQMFQLLFTDSGFSKKARNTLKNNSMGITKEALLQKIQDYEEKTVWGSLVGSDTLSVFQENFDFLKGVRNDVMHAHNLDTEVFREARDLLEEVNRQLEEAISEIAMKTVQTNRKQEWPEAEEPVELGASGPDDALLHPRETESEQEQSAENLDEEKHRKLRKLAPLLKAGVAAPILMNTIFGLGLLTPAAPVIMPCAPSIIGYTLMEILIGKGENKAEAEGEAEAVPESGC